MVKFCLKQPLKNVSLLQLKWKFIAVKMEVSSGVLLMATLETITTKTKRISADKFASMSDKERANLSVIKIIPPSLSRGNDFGKVVVRIKQPTYEVIF